MFNIVASFAVGIIFGLWRARRRGGDRADMALYATVFGLIFAVIAAMVTVALLRLG